MSATAERFDLDRMEYGHGRDGKRRWYYVHDWATGKTRSISRGTYQAAQREYEHRREVAHWRRVAEGLADAVVIWAEERALWAAENREKIAEDPAFDADTHAACRAEAMLIRKAIREINPAWASVADAATGKDG